MIKEIIEKQKTENIIELRDEIDIETQKKIERRLLEIFGFDLSRGRIDESAHPYCMGSLDDTRLTTKHYKENFLFSSFAVIHELGHGLYQQNLPREYKYQPVGSYKGCAFHESQSLIMEIQVGNSRSLIEFFAKLLRDEFSLKGEEYSAENLYKIKTRVQPNLIRIDADEVTYPLHVILRSEIEQLILSGDIKAKDIPELWNSKMKEYLGIESTTYSNGCLQDIHWPENSSIN